MAGQRKIEGDESRSVPHSFSAKDISSEIEEFKRELKDSCEDLEESATIDDVALQPEKKSVADAAQPAMRVTPASDKLPETDNPPEMPAPLGARLKTVESRQTPRSRAVQDA